MNLVEKLAKRNFGRVALDGSPVIRWYYHLESRQPVWWDGHPRPQESWSTLGRPLGVFENVPSEATDAIVIGTHALAVIRSQGHRIIPYRDIRSWDQISKEPVATSLDVALQSGERVCLPTRGATAFTLATFLCSAPHFSDLDEQRGQ